MTTLDVGIAALRSSLSALRTAGGRFYDVYDRTSTTLKNVMPKGLYARALLIIIAPMVVLQSVVAYMFMERHYNLVTQRLSAGVVQDIATLIEVYKVFPQDADHTQLRRIAQDKLGLVVDFLPVNELPPPGPKPFFSLVDQALSEEVRRQIGRPFWIDTVGRSALLEIRIKLDNAVMRVFAPRRAAYVSNSHIFLLWMVGTSLVLITVAILFLRNQIRPILRLADAAESFGKGREVPDFRPRGAREVRRAGQAFIEMKRRIERAIEQRTAMLAGVSHDLRTILTRFKLELALIGDSPRSRRSKKDVDEMARMLEAYLAFARGDFGEQSAPTDMAAFLEELKTDTERNGHETSVDFHGHPIVTVRPAAFKRCLANLVSNAARYAPSIAITGHRDHRWLTVTVDDDGPGIPPHMREEVFKPFLRLDDARNQDEGGTGLGLAIARDIARSHGGDITLADSPLRRPARDRAGAGVARAHRGRGRGLARSAASAAVSLADVVCAPPRASARGRRRPESRHRSSSRPDQRWPRASARSSAAIVRARPGSSSSTQVRSTEANSSASPCARTMPRGPAAPMSAAVSIHCCERTARPLSASARPRIAHAPSAAASAPPPGAAPAARAGASARRTAARAAVPRPCRHRSPASTCAVELLHVGGENRKRRAELRRAARRATRRRARRSRQSRSARSTSRRAAP